MGIRKTYMVCAGKFLQRKFPEITTGLSTALSRGAKSDMNLLVVVVKSGKKDALKVKTVKRSSHRKDPKVS